MSKVVIISGPEKAGKTTLISYLGKELDRRQFSYRIRKQNGRAFPNDSIYFEHLLQDASDSEVDFVIWDRSWVAEFVYGSLLQDGRRMASDGNPAIGEYLYSPLISRGYVLIGPSVEELIKNRTSDDLDVDVEEERKAYTSYGDAFPSWEVIENQHSKEYVEELSRKIIGANLFKRFPPNYYGSEYPEAFVVKTPNNFFGFSDPTIEFIHSQYRFSEVAWCQLFVEESIIGNLTAQVKPIVMESNAPIVFLDQQSLEILKSFRIPESRMINGIIPSGSHVTTSKEYAEASNEINSIFGKFAEGIKQDERTT